MIDHDKRVGQPCWSSSTTWASPTTPSSCTRTDNGPHMNSWPDAGMTPFRNEKNSNWEGAYRVPAHGALAGQDQGRHRVQRALSATRLVPHAAGRRRRAGHRRSSSSRDTGLDGKTYKVHLDGYNLLPYLTGADRESPRKRVLLCL